MQAAAMYWNGRSTTYLCERDRPLIASFRLPRQLLNRSWRRSRHCCRSSASGVNPFLMLSAPPNPATRQLIAVRQSAILCRSLEPPAGFNCPQCLRATPIWHGGFVFGRTKKGGNHLAGGTPALRCVLHHSAPDHLRGSSTRHAADARSHQEPDFPAKYLVSFWRLRDMEALSTLADFRLAVEPVWQFAFRSALLTL
jgi:hypothetical protein